MMPAPTIEERVSLLETDMGQVKQAMQPPSRKKNPWATFGLMAGSTHYDEIVRLGAEYRQQDREQVLREHQLEPNA